MNIDNIEQIVEKTIKEIGSINDVLILRRLEIKYLGRNGLLTKILRNLSKYHISIRKKKGAIANKAKKILSNEINKKMAILKKSDTISKIENETIDCSSVFYFPFLEGSFHPIMNAMYNIVSIFQGLGFFVADGPEMETDWYNFEALNIPKNHSVRDIQDTFYIQGTEKLLRTHTSPVQIHIMENQNPPIKVIVPGRVYRNEHSDSTHSPIFHQIEGLVVEENVNFTDLKFILKKFIDIFFDKSLEIRFRPSYFQFTEPSAEVDIKCFYCNKNSYCKICKNSGWIEILGCGMVHPNVFKSVNYDYEKYNGYAFGIGIERILMIKHRINDIRLFYENNLGFLKQF
ncbi:MAG: phenylalanine--tRNA ligase subunit alpha [Endomicrobium sp.]|jgi:phenylalanyl-tRNA synthetase alpha chain|nr:phenylalanine--tRNA ligase subunit alpha [Endomicrobium sp.]